jgi:hypothetical protein
MLETEANKNYKPMNKLIFIGYEALFFFLKIYIFIESTIKNRTSALYRNFMEFTCILQRKEIREPKAINLKRLYVLK